MHSDSLHRLVHANPSDPSQEVIIGVVGHESERGQTRLHESAEAIAASKAALRRRIRAARLNRTPQQRAAEEQALARTVLELPELVHADLVTLYAHMPGEPETTVLRAALARRGIRVLLPIVLPHARLDWAFDDGDLMQPNGFGGPEPTGERLGEDAPLSADVLLIPALAVDTLGHRLGQGAGYYDRVLARIEPSRVVVALVHDDELLDAAVEPVPIGEHDQSVDVIATAQRCLRLR